jgi:fucose permease
MLKLWGTRHSGPYFTALHFFFGIGNALGPILADIFLGHEITEGVVSMNQNETMLLTVAAQTAVKNVLTPLQVRELS